MDRKTHYQIAFKQGAIQQKEAEEYIDALGEDTLDVITKMSFNRRLIKPILEVAAKEVNDNPDIGFDEAVNNIISNKTRMMALMHRYCM